MILGATIATLLGLIALGFVAAPLLRGEDEPAAREAEAASEARDLLAQREMVLSSLRDLEDDHATTKISDEDYVALKQQLTRQAVDVLRRLDEAKSAVEQELSRPRLRPVPDGGKE